VDTYGAGLRGLAQHTVRRFASALEVIPRTVAENAHGGAEGNEIVARLLAKHEKAGDEPWGVDVEVSSPVSPLMSQKPLAATDILFSLF
jgi:T-complex protein 1 subunit theta